MHKYLAITITILAILISITAPVYSESLWKDAKADALSDKRAAKVGDVITIIIMESAASSQAASTDASKNAKSDISPGVGPLLEKIPGLTYSGSDSIKGSGSTTRSTTFNARMSATIKKINDNGTLEIEGTRLIQTNKEKQEIKLTGTIRQQDIATDNTIQSTAIANATIIHMGSGPIGGRQKEGIITKIIRILF